MKIPASLILVTGLSILISCGKKPTPNPDPQPSSPAWVANQPFPALPDPTVDIYLAGSEWDENDNIIISYWKNGVATVLGNGIYPQSYGYCNSIIVRNNDVYATAYVPITTSRYWKNGNAILLNQQPYVKDELTMDVDVSGDDVYVLSTDNDHRFVYWKNADMREINLTTAPDYMTDVTSIAVLNNDCYIAGWIWNRATYWKNGEPYPLENLSPKNSKAAKISIFNNDIYIAGCEDFHDYFDSVFSYAVYWKNGQEVFLDRVSNTAANAVYVSGNDVYLCGIKRGPNNSDPRAVYWKNGELITLSNDYSSAYCISMVNGHLYVCGTYKDKAALWIDGQLFYTFNHYSVFLDMKIIKK